MYLEPFKNIDFMLSEEARPLRILSEYSYPLSVLKKQDIKSAIVFFGSARIHLESEDQPPHLKQYYEDTVQISKKLTEWALTKCKNPSRQDKFVICTGGGPGIMEAGNKGARLAGGRSIALNIKLPHEQAANPYVDPNLTFTFHYFFMRKLWFMQLAEAVVVMPGGFGTIDELFEVLTLIQTSKAAKIPIILYGKDFWNDLINFEKLADYKLIERSDLNLIYKTDSVDEAVEFIVTYLESDMFQ